ncbi:hypothetical protein D9M69_521950 [compost metagenome]
MYLANLASEGAMICTSPSSSASISLPSPNSWLLGKTWTSTLPASFFSASSLNFRAAWPLGVMSATTWLYLMTMGAAWAVRPRASKVVASANFSFMGNVSRQERNRRRPERTPASVRTAGRAANCGVQQPGFPLDGEHPRRASRDPLKGGGTGRPAKPARRCPGLSRFMRCGWRFGAAKTDMGAGLKL